MSFVGRAEPQVCAILSRLLSATLIKPTDYTKHVDSWDDDIDVINSLKMHNILK